MQVKSLVAVETSTSCEATPQVKPEKAENPEVFSQDQGITIKSKNSPDDPFIKINTDLKSKKMHYVDSRPEKKTSEMPGEQCITFASLLQGIDKLPTTDRGIDDESDEYAFSAYSKNSKKYQAGKVKGKIEHFETMTGVERATFRTLYGDTSGDKKFNFDGAAIGLEFEVKQNAYLVNQNPEIYLPVDHNSNYFFESRNMAIAPNNGNLTAVFALEGVKIGVRYEKGKGIGIGNVEFHDGAITTNVLEFAKEKPYIAAPIVVAVAGAVVTGAYFINKGGKEPMNLTLGNITVYRNDSDEHKVRVGIAPSISLTGAEQFKDAFRLPGAAASVLYKYDNNLTLNVNGGYNPTDGAHAFAGAAMKF